MNETAPPPTGHHPDWLPFIAAVELALGQLGDPDRAMTVVTDAVDSWASASESWVPVLIEDERGVRRLMTSKDKLKMDYPAYWDDDDRQKLAKEWRDERRDEFKFFLCGEPVLVFVWRLKLEEFLGLRPAAAHEAKEPPERKSAKRRTKRAKQLESEQRTWISKKLISAVFDCLQKKHQDKYSDSFAGAEPAILRAQAKPFWSEVCLAEHVDSKDHPLPSWDSFKRERDRRVALERGRDRRRD